MSTLERLQNIFADVFDDDDLKINRDTTANDIEDWDSLTNMQLVVEIEHEFHIKLTTAEIKKISSVGEIIDIIDSRL